jgi:Zn finger protein HypA/HybF involved in hydrogenase expression
MRLDRIIERRRFFWVCKDCKHETEPDDDPPQPESCDECSSTDLDMASDYFPVYGDNF